MEYPAHVKLKSGKIVTVDEYCKTHLTNNDILILRNVLGQLGQINNDYIDYTTTWNTNPDWCLEPSHFLEGKL